VSGLVLDTGALIAFERNDRRVVAIVATALRDGDILVVPAGVIAQVWRNGRRQARLARLLRSPVCRVEPLDDVAAKVVGQLLGVTATSDVVHGHVAAVARARGMAVMTNDSGDIHRLDPTIAVVAV
jgi:predicted nucleic acid-binding protein